MVTSLPILSNVGQAVTTSTFTRQQVELTGGDVTTTSNSFVDATGMTITLARTVTGGIFFASAGVDLNNSIATDNEFIRWVDGATNKTACIVDTSTNAPNNASIPCSGALSGQIIKIQFRRTAAGTVTMYGGTSADLTSMMQVAEIG